MKTILFFAMALAAIAYLVARARVRPSTKFHSVDVIVPAFNEALMIEQSLINLLRNPYFHRVICVDDGSTDGTGEIVARLAEQTSQLVLVSKENGGKGSAIMKGLEHVTADYVFLTDADTYVPFKTRGLGYMIAEIDRGADAVGGVPSSDLRGGGLLGYVRASVKLPMIVIKRTFQQILGGAPFIVSGACGMFRADVLREVGLTDRTNVEDLDLTWSLVAAGYKVRQVNRAIVYPQECKTLREEWRRWRRWIMGYAVCMRLHWRLLFSRYGLFSILPMFLLVVFGVATYGMTWTRAVVGGNAGLLPSLLFPLLWVGVVMILGGISAWHHNKVRLLLMAPLALMYVILAYAVWLTHGLQGLITGREYGRDKPTRYARVVA
jgi:cellulose synthase/poly-beta-1,6-N-acetylglucosamine synthase-like glycosyltransferase